MYSHESLDRLEDTYQLMLASTVSDRTPDAVAILALRHRFAIEFSSLSASLANDLNRRENRALRYRLQDRLKTLRIRLMSYTMAWQPAQIEQDPEGYRDAAQTIAEMVRRFIVETRAALDEVVDAGRDFGPDARHGESWLRDAGP